MRWLPQHSRSTGANGLLYDTVGRPRGDASRRTKNGAEPDEGDTQHRADRTGERVDRDEGGEREAAKSAKGRMRDACLGYEAESRSDAHAQGDGEGATDHGTSEQTDLPRGISDD